MSRPQNRRAGKPKNDKPKKKVKEPETFDDFLSEGITFEEQGERYKEGDRAQRNYERAADMYSKAHSLNDQDADCLYNWGRVLYILVGFYPAHTEPEEKLKKLDQAIEKFRGALTLAANKTDAQFNLAQALHLRSEILQDTTEVDNSYMQSAMALQEAITLFEAVYDLQEKEFNDQNTNESEHQQEQKHDHHHDHDHDHHDHDHEHKQEKEKKNAPTTTSSSSEYTTVTEVEPTTAYSLIDTLLSMADTMTTMASMLASYQSSVDLFSKSRSKLSIAEKWLAGTSEDNKEHTQARIQINLKEAQNFSAQAERSFLASKTVDHALFQQAIGRLDAIIEQLDSRHVEAMCDRGDVLGTYAELLTKQEGNKPTTDVWHYYAQADKSLKAALQIENKNLNILNKLGDLSIARARLDLPVAKRNMAQLLKNAEFYFKQAVDTDRQVLTSGYVSWAYSTWALEVWAQVPDKKKAAEKIIKLWLTRGGSAEMFGDITEDVEILDSKFIEWVNESFFESEETSSSDEE